jgi:hypothetical protein
VALDVDQYRSSVSALKVFEAEATHLAPVVPVWVDDSYLSVLQTTFAGEGLAIREFNEAHALRKIEQKVVRTDDHPGSGTTASGSPTSSTTRAARAGAGALRPVLPHDY